MDPVYVGQPKTARTFTVGRWGKIRCGGPCKDDYANIETYVQNSQYHVRLQEPAIRSLKAAEREIHNNDLGAHILTTGSWRSCDFQAQLYASDPKRYAPPDVCGHVRGLNIDVSMDQDAKKLAAIHTALTKRWWFQPRNDEPWHYSFGISV